MHPSGQHQFPGGTSGAMAGAMAGGAQNDGRCTAFLGYPNGNYAGHPERYNPQHHTTIARVVEPNSEGTANMTVPDSSYTLGRATKAFGWPQAPPIPIQLLLEVPPNLSQGIPAPVVPYGDMTTPYEVYAQNEHVRMSYSSSLAVTNGFRHNGATAVADLDRPVYPLIFVNNLGSAPRPANRFTDFANPATEVDRLGLWVFDPRLGNYAAPYLGAVDVGYPPANNETVFSVPYTRRTRTGRRAPVGGPPQTFEGNPTALTTRLANEGADPDAVDLVRRVIFVVEVTERALTAPIKSRQLSLKHGGARKRWQMLLQATEVEPGVKSYCCRLCTEERRPEYKNAADGLRHLKRDHFGISVACKYCGHEFFRVAEMNRHIRRCRQRPTMGAVSDGASGEEGGNM